MKIIVLTNSVECLVDDEDFVFLSEFRWCSTGRYACRLPKKGRTVMMHREIMGAHFGIPEHNVIDHINGDGLDNRKLNLRFATHSQNLWNQWPKKKSSSQYKGVWLDKSREGKSAKWKAEIRKNNKAYYLGRFDEEIDAALAYDRAAKELFREFACLNFENHQSITRPQGDERRSYGNW